MFDTFVTLGPIQLPLIIIVIFVASWLVSIAAWLYTRSVRNKAINENPDYARIIGKGVTFQELDGERIKVFYQGQYHGIVLPSGKHELLVIGSETEYKGLRGRKTSVKQTPPTPLNVTVEASQTYDLVFTFEDGFVLKKSKKQI